VWSKVSVSPAAEEIAAAYAVSGAAGAALYSACVPTHIQSRLSNLRSPYLKKLGRVSAGELRSFWGRCEL
jgi:hypothetical protein